MWPFGGEKKKRGASGSADTPPENVFDDPGGSDSRFDSGEPESPLAGGGSGQQPDSKFSTGGFDEGFSPSPLSPPQGGEP